VSETFLEDVIEFYDRREVMLEKNRSLFITSMGLTRQEKKDRVEFLKALEG